MLLSAALDRVLAMSRQVAQTELEREAVMIVEAFRRDCVHAPVAEKPAAEDVSKLSPGGPG